MVSPREEVNPVSSIAKNEIIRFNSPTRLASDAPQKDRLKCKCASHGVAVDRRASLPMSTPRANIQ